jgi:uncharacterized protein YacL
MIQRNGKSSPLANVARDVSQVAHDVVELAELQVALLKTEVQGWWKQFIMPVVLATSASVILICCLLLLMASAALQLAESTDLSLALSVLLTACGGMIIALILAVVGYSIVKKARGPLEESKLELSRNLRWIKAALKSTGRAPH